MVTAAQLSRLDAKLGVLAAAIDEDGQPVAVVVFRSETRDFALQRHRELRPDHADRPVRFEHRNDPRTGPQQAIGPIETLMSAGRHSMMLWTS
jgi:hypothetical protein